MDGLFHFSTAVHRDAAVEAWMAARPGPLGNLARQWFDVMRACGDDVHELLHDGHPTACAGDAAFGYVNVFTSHVNVGFFKGAELNDPAGLGVTVAEDLLAQGAQGILDAVYGVSGAS